MASRNGDIGWLIEVPETSGVCLLGVRCKLWDRWGDLWRLVYEGTLEECETALEAAELLKPYP